MASELYARATSSPRRRLLSGCLAFLLLYALLQSVPGRSSAAQGHASEPVRAAPAAVEEVAQAEPLAPPPPPPVLTMPICQNKHTEGAYDNLRMTTSQCDQDFGPKLWKEIDLAEAYYAERGGISAEDAEDAEADSTLRLKVLNGQLYIKKYGWAPNSRAMAATQAVWRALLTSPEAMPDLDFSLSLDDIGPPTASRWVLDRKDEDEGKAWLMPDFGFYSWPEPWVGSWRDYRCRANEVISQYSWTKKIDKLFWRGATMHPNRHELIDIASRHDWGDVLAIDWNDPHAATGQRIAMQDHCKYRYLAQAEGWAYSGRLKYLLMCSSVVVSHRMQYTQHFHSLFDADPLSEQQNIVVVDNDGWSGLEATMKDLQLDDDRTRRIAENSRRTFYKYLSPAAETCYWRRALRAYAGQQAGHVPQSLDGWLDYESFALARDMHWGPH